MIELISVWLAGFCTGVALTGGLAGWCRPRMGPPKRRFKQPEQPIAADLIRHWRWQDEQVRQALEVDTNSPPEAP